MEAENLDTLDLTHIFTPEVMLPIQVDSPPAHGWLWCLCLAIFEDALKCLEVRVVRKRRVVARARYRQEAWAWVLSDAEYCFSFTTVCSVLHLDAEAVRRQLRHRFAGRATRAGVSRQLRQPLSRAPAARSA